jgi:hypothetical protein
MSSVYGSKMGAWLPSGGHSPRPNPTSSGAIACPSRVPAAGAPRAWVGRLGLGMGARQCRWCSQRCAAIWWRRRNQNGERTSTWVCALSQYFVGVSPLGLRRHPGCPGRRARMRGARSNPIRSLQLVALHSSSLARKLDRGTVFVGGPRSRCHEPCPRRLSHEVRREGRRARGTGPPTYAPARVFLQESTRTNFNF